MAWYAYPEQETRGGRLILARRPAGSTRFQRGQPILEQMRSSLGNPVLFCDVEDRLHLLFVVLRGHYWTTAVVNTSHSDDSGRTWSSPQALPFEPGMMVRYPPIERQNGYYLLPAYDENRNHTAMLTAGPDGTGWFPVTRFDGMKAIQGSIVRQGESELVMMLRPCGDNRTCLRSISEDDGRSWSPVMRTALPNPLSGVAAFQVNGTTCAVYNHTTEHRRHPLILSYSEDRGTSWSGPIHIDERAMEVSYPSFVTDPEGAAHGVYTAGRNRIQYVSFDRSWWEK